MNTKRLDDTLVEQVELYHMLGNSYTEIADHLYNECQICYWERDLIKEMDHE